MAANVNRVFLMGNLTRDPELRYIPSGTAVANFTIAVNRVYSTQTGEKKEEVCFVRIVVWGRRAEVCGEYLSKGSPAFVEGRLRSRSWQAPDGQNRSTIEVVADNVQFLGGANRGKQKLSTKADDVPKASPQEEDVASVDLNEGNEGSEEIPF